ncbi:Geranylgeranyl transferase type-1 subunit beta [Gryganskiella cystojenkinii]|nr:Geranylgeranyl transferase type-1 subunit beta [Gryganskiella cystojenkinii]
MLNTQDPPSVQGNTSPEAATAESAAAAELKRFSREKHIQYFKRTLQMMPQPYTSMDTHRMMLGMFALSGLELLGVLEETVSEADRKAWIEWVYSQQRVPSDEDTGDLKNEALYGFGGGPFSGLAFQKSNEMRTNRGCECDERSTVHDTAHVTMTYTALMTLVLLGDDLSRVAKEPILRSLRRLQGEDGCFIPCVTDQQSDLRFVYSAAALSYLLNDWSGFDQERALKFIRDCNTYEHGFSQSPRQEAHGGTTYCAIATLGLLGGDAIKDQKLIAAEYAARERKNEIQELSLEEQLARSGYVDKEGTRKWCIQRQTTGFQGRTNKPTDTCYSFWVGGALAILGSYDLVNFEYNRGYLMETQHPGLGGFGKWPDMFPDVMHSYMGLAGLSLMGEPGLQPLNPLLSASTRMELKAVTEGCRRAGAKHSVSLVVLYVSFCVPVSHFSSSPATTTTTVQSRLQHPSAFMATFPPPLRVQINGILLSTLLFECANARVDYEGLVLGAVVSKTRSVVDDTSDLRVKTVSTTVDPNLPKFYSRSGEIQENVLENYSIPSNLTILGYLKYRRSETHQQSLRDMAVALKLKMYMERKQALAFSTSNPFAAARHVEPFPVLLALVTAKTNENMSTHDYNYTFWSVGDDESSFEALPVEISNMIESPQEDYQSFQSNLALGASRHASSAVMMKTINAVPTTLLIDGHEAMFKNSFEAAMSLTQNVITSDEMVRDALKEIEQLKEKIERSKLEGGGSSSSITPIPPPVAHFGKRELDETDEISVSQSIVTKTKLALASPSHNAASHRPDHSALASRPPPRPIGLSSGIPATVRSPPPPPVPLTLSQSGGRNATNSPPDLLY